MKEDLEALRLRMNSWFEFWSLMYLKDEFARSQFK